MLQQSLAVLLLDSVLDRQVVAGIRRRVVDEQHGEVLHVPVLNWILLYFLAEQLLLVAMLRCFIALPVYCHRKNGTTNRRQQCANGGGTSRGGSAARCGDASGRPKTEAQ